MEVYVEVYADGGIRGCNSNSNSKINLYSAPYTNNHCPAALYTDEKDTKNTKLNNGNVNGCKRHENIGFQIALKIRNIVSSSDHN